MMRDIMNLQEVKELDHEYLFQNYARQELCFDHGQEEYLYDLDGRRYIDLVAGIAVNVLGYAHPALVRAICEQSQKLIHVSNLYLVREQALAAEALASILPEPLTTSIFVNSGAEANEAALKLAVKRTGRTKVVSTLNSFHGRTSGPLSATGQPKYQSGFEPLLSKAFDFVPYRDSEQLKAAVTKDTAAVILEPVQGEGGVILAGKEYFRTARDVCDDQGALLIVDEVQTGLGRTGKMFGFQHYGIVPDIITLAKALGGGFPIGACVTSAEIASTFKPGMHGTTFGGNPLACAAAKVVIETIVKEKLVERSQEMGGQWAARLKGIAKQGSVIGDVRGQGLMIGMEMGQEAKKFQSYALGQGILINVCAGSVVRLIPPLIVKQTSLSAFDEALGSFLSGAGK
jgi:acetylornithine/N-succinyldiaminopimelate aminotransferase